MSQHTPGPWAARQEFANRWRIEQIPADGLVPLSVGIVCTTLLEVGVSNHNTEENAHLIAAAPELLAALQGLLAWDKRRNFIVPYSVRDNIRAAIAKAEGANHD